MAKKGRLEQKGEEDYGLDEVDAFAAAKDKILFENATARIHGQRDDDEDSDEAVMGLDSGSDVSESEEDGELQDEDDDDAEYFGKKDDLEMEEDEEDGVWGENKNAYYGDDDVEDEEQARQLEQEALRLQKKHLEELNMDDYVDEEMEEEWSKSAKKHDFGDVLESSKEKSTQSITDLSSMDGKQKKKFIQQSHPELIPLTKQLAKLKPVLDDLAQRKDENEVANVKFTALSAYLGAITVYFALVQSLAKEEEPFSMKEHPIMESILSTKEVWRQASELEEVDDEESDEEMEGQPLEVSPEADSDGDVFDSASESIPEEVLSQMADSDSESEESEQGGDEDEDLDIDITKPRVLKRPQAQVTEDFAEGSIADVDAEEKKARKKTLRFYTSKIDQQAKKKEDKFAGDEDLPYRERLFERQQRLIEEARKRGLHDDHGDDLDADASFDEADAQEAKEINDEFDDSYYNTVKSSKIAMKSKRKQLHEEAVRAAREGKLAEIAENVGEDGKRAVNYQILKNKGLTPHRKKDNRNARVKKRKKYEQAKKKLKSVRAVYQQPTGAYDGEKTGIKKNLSKSVKF